MVKTKKVNAVIFSLIGGVCFGIEFLWDYRILVVDLGIFRITFYKVEEEYDDRIS